MYTVLCAGAWTIPLHQKFQKTGEVHDQGHKYLLAETHEYIR